MRTRQKLRLLVGFRLWRDALSLKREVNRLKDLLHHFAAERDEGAFASLVERHAGLVYAVALRQTSDAAGAEEISQNVFAVLARKAPALAREFDEVTIARWLHRSALLESRNFVRKEINRGRHMKEFAEDEKARAESAAAEVVDEVASSLDEAIDRLPEKDREVVMLRFYEGENFQAIGRFLGKTEDAAQKQTSRAVEKLREILGRMGVAVPAAALVAALPASLAQAAPAGVALTVSRVVLDAAPVVASGSIASALLIMNANKVTLLAALGLLIVLAVPIAVQEKTIAALETQVREAESSRVSLGGGSSAGRDGLIGKAADDRTTMLGGAQEGADIDLDDLMDRMLAAVRTMNFSEMLQIQSTLEALSASMLKDGLARVVQRGFSPEQTDEIRNAFLARLAEKDPHFVLDWAMEHREGFSSAASALGILAEQDSEVAMKWFHEARRSGMMEARGVGDDAEVQFGAALVAGLAKADFEAALAMIDDFGPAVAGEAAEGMGVWLAMNGGDSQRLFSLLEAVESTRDRAGAVLSFAVNLAERDPTLAKATMADAGLPPEDYNFAIREYAGASVMNQPKRQVENLEWMIRESSPAYLGENVKHYVYEWMTANRKGAIGWADALDAQPYRDDALAGVASWYRTFGKDEEAMVWINQIADEGRRSELANEK